MLTIKNISKQINELIHNCKFNNYAIWDKNEVTKC